MPETAHHFLPPAHAISVHWTLVVSCNQCSAPCRMLGVEDAVPRSSQGVARKLDFYSEHVMSLKIKSIFLMIK